MSDPLFIDIHCHPSLKPYARSYPSNKNSRNRRKRRSIWYRKKPRLLTEIINEYGTTTHFTQSDFQTLCKGNIRVIFASLSPLERGFFVSRLGTGPVTDLVAQWATGIGFRKINFVQRNTNYFSELELEMNFYEQLNGKKVRTLFGRKEYRIVRNYQEIVDNLAESENIISVIPAIEGSHVFNEDNSREPDPAMILDNIDKVLAWPSRPFFISPAHHFYNYICGHAYSLTNILKKLLDQDDHVNTGFTDLGEQVVRKLLDNGVLIDIKHMSRRSRRTFFSMMEEESYKEIPVIVSHGNVNGYPTVDTDDELEEDHGLFYGADINFFDDEIIKVERSKGLFGIQLDERRIASKDELDKIKHSLPDEVRHRMFAKLMWNQMLYIAKLLDDAGEDAWNCMCIGSDYDGIVDPMDGFWTGAEFGLLHDYVLEHAMDYLTTHPNSFSKASNNIGADEILEKIASGNVLRFLSEHFR